VATEVKAFINLFKVRIGVAIAFAAAAGLAVERGSSLGFSQKVILVLAVLVAAAAAGAFNQYVERDLDMRMARTRNRPFVTGTLKHGPFWLWVIGAMIAASVIATSLAANPLAATYVFLGAFTTCRLPCGSSGARGTSWWAGCGPSRFSRARRGARLALGARSRRCCSPTLPHFWASLSPAATTTRPRACRCCRS
jgi:hypothetical protein